MKSLLILVLAMLAVSVGYSQEVIENTPVYQNDVPFAYGLSEKAIMSLCILLIGLMVIVCETVFIHKMGKELQMDGIDAIRLITVTLIILGALFVANGSYPESGTAAVTGLLGTLAGYLLARGAQITPKSESTNSSEKKESIDSKQVPATSPADEK